MNISLDGRRMEVIKTRVAGLKYGRSSEEVNHRIGDARKTIGVCTFESMGKKRHMSRGVKVGMY